MGKKVTGLVSRGPIQRMIDLVPLSNQHRILVIRSFLPFITSLLLIRSKIYSDLLSISAYYNTQESTPTIPNNQPDTLHYS